MPCRNDLAEEESRRNDYDELGVVSATLCGVLTVLENTGSFDPVLDCVDWNEAGLTKRKAIAWWIKHKREDEARREKERAEKTAMGLQKNALNKLSDEELKALGLKRIS